MFGNSSAKKSDLDNSSPSTQQTSANSSDDPRPEVTSVSQNSSVLPLNSPHDAIINQIDNEVGKLQDASGPGQTSPAKLRNRELPENLYDPFDGQSVGVMVPGEFGEEEDDLWTHLAEIRNLQSDVARMHAQMERLGENDRFYAPEETGEEETVNVGDETKAEKTAEFTKLSDRFSVRKEAIDAIMQKLQTLSKSINDFHSSRAPVFRSLSSPVPREAGSNAEKPGAASTRTDRDVGSSMPSNNVLSASLKDSPNSMSRALADPPEQTRTKLFGEDIVQRIDDPSNSSTYGIVMRCWHDSDDMQIQGPTMDPLLRPLKRGEVGVSFFPNNMREILPESSFRLLDRPMQAGDLCKRSFEDVQSAVVTDVHVRFKGSLKVAHAVSRIKLEDWKSVDDIKEFDDIAVGDFVVYNDWVGQIQEFFDESVIQTSDGSLVRLPEISAHLVVGERGPDILPAPPEQGIQGIISYFMGELRPSSDDLVVSVKHTVCAVAWMAVNQSLTPEEASKRNRPKQFWYGKDISQLTLLRGINDQLPRVGDRLILKSVPEHVLTVHGQEDQKAGAIRVETFVICETETTVDLLWQNGSSERARSTELIPYLNPDEYDCWPGDHVIWKTEDERHGAVVQSVNASERTAQIVLYSGRREVVSVLELDTHGAASSGSNPQEAFGVRRGDLVFIHREGDTNGCLKPMVPSIGELEPWIHEVPFEDEETGELSGWRKELDRIGRMIAQKHEPAEGDKIRRPEPGRCEIDWFGEVTNLRLDGVVKVTLLDLRKVDVPLERISRLRDGLEQLEDLWGDELSDSHSVYDPLHDDEGTYEVQTEDGRWQQFDDGSEEDWVDEDVDETLSDLEDVADSMEVDEITTPDTVIHGNGVVPGAWPSPGEGADNIQPQASSTPRPECPEITRMTTDIIRKQLPIEPSWKRFDILPSAPPDHAFFETTADQPSRQFMARLSKEYRALSTSLPESIIVRTYEDRTDLLRSLIIGPENTPYEDAPFVIDWKLDGNFPQSPPIAHFHSWTNGNGRVNPNLYEEGKVCLSILGTWAGDRSESWNPARSSLLQAFVSIQGLVLVKEPWYCEPAYEKLRGTTEGKVNSRLYNEKAYVLSRGFVRRALEVPVGGLEDVIKDIYITRGKLAKVITSAHSLIEKSRITKESEDDNGELAVPRLTGGGIIPLTRILDKLEVLSDVPS
ncbi:hypothetical protein ACEPAF_3779 [Sanghuangporus sanghuang]